MRGSHKRLAAVAAAAAVLAGAFANRSEAAIAYALTDENDLLRIDTAAPQDILSGGVITGLAGQDLIGIDFRPANGQLYGVGNLGGVFQINPNTRAATLVSTLVVDPTDLTSPFAGLSGSRFGVDFNPVADRLRLVSDTEQNLRVNVDTGLTITDTDLQYGPSEPGATGDNPAVTAVAYTNTFAPSPRSTPGTVLYAIDLRTTEDRLLIQNPPNNGTLTVVGPLGVNASALTGFDILSDGVGGETGFAALQQTTSGISQLYAINLGTGAATLIGDIGAGDLIDGFAVVPIPEPAGLGLLALAGTALLRRRRTGA